MNNTKPEIRFQGFEDEWEEKKLGSMGSKYPGLSGKNREDFGHGNAKFVTYMNVFNNPIAKLDDLGVIEVDEKQQQVKKGDVFFTSSSETPNEVGMSSVWMFDIPNVYLNSFTFAYRPTEKFDLNYLAFMLRSPLVRRQFMMLAQGISRFNISGVKAMEVKVPVPNIEEQTKIGSFFKQLDDSITLHQRKLDLLKEMKKGYLQKMFPKDGETGPEVRFAGFEDEWEEKKLGEISETYSGGTPSVVNKAYYEGTIPFIRSGEIASDSTALTITSLGLENSSAKIVNPGDVLYALYGATSGEVAVSNLYGAINQAVLAIKLNKENNNYFIYQQLKKNKEAITHQYLQGGQGNLSGEIVRNLTVITAGTIEQTKIGSFFKQLDDSITLHQRKLDLLKELKKGFLQKMFV